MNPIENDQVIVSRLSAEAKQLLWRGMKALDPGQAELLQDPEFAAMKEKFDGSVGVSLADYRRFVNWAMANPPAGEVTRAAV